MGVSVTDLITEAYYDSSVVARQFETIQGYQLTDGLKWLNQLLGDTAVDSGRIPYITQQYAFNGVVGQEKYFIPNCASIDTIVFYIGSGSGPNGATTVRYHMQYLDRIKYFGQPRANNINALPVSYTYERVFGGINLWVYFPPQQAYEFNITGNFFMSTVTLNQDLTLPITTANLGVPTIFGTTTNLGVCTILGTGVLAAGELTINGIDMAGTYVSPAAFVAAINTGIVPDVTATLSGSSVKLIGSVGTITLVTLGTVTTDGLTFANFSTVGGPLTVSFAQPGTINIGNFVVNNVDLSGGYATIDDLVACINTGIIPFVTANIINFEFILTSTTGVTISLVTLGTESTANGLTFARFSLINGYFSQNFFGFALDQFYIDFLEYQLADRICQKLNFEVPPGITKQLSEYDKVIKNMAEVLDLTCQKISCLQDPRALNYAQANLGYGYTTGGF